MSSRGTKATAEPVASAPIAYVDGRSETDGLLACGAPKRRVEGS